jgi:hypothetical protein
MVGVYPIGRGSHDASIPTRRTSGEACLLMSPVCDAQGTLRVVAKNSRPSGQPALTAPTKERSGPPWGLRLDEAGDGWLRATRSRRGSRDSR